jgi:hypothetical protein
MDSPKYTDPYRVFVPLWNLFVGDSSTPLISRRRFLRTLYGIPMTVSLGNH